MWLARIARRVANRFPALDPVLRRLMLKARDTKSRPKIAKGEGYLQRTGRNFTVISPDPDPDGERFGIYLRGGCDLPAVYGVAKLMRDSVPASIAILRDPIQIAGARSDILLQSLEHFGPDAQNSMREVVDRLRLQPHYFDPVLFEPTFHLPGSEREYPKKVVVLTAAADYSRSIYRHREYGYLVDPGGYWLTQSIDSVLTNTDTVEWFSKNFKKVGRMTVDEFREMFSRVLTETKARTGAHILVFNMLTIDPSDETHNYRLVKQPDTARRKAFTIGLAELSREFDIDIVDVDRVLKMGGVQGQVDFAHFSEEQMEPVAREVHRILKIRELV